MTKDTNENMEVPEDLFKSVKFFLIGNISDKIESLLNKGGGKRDHYLSQMVTHAIAEDVTEDDYSEAKELFELPVVTSRWVELSCKCGYLLPMNAFSPEPEQIFSGVVACPSQLSKEDGQNLWSIITTNGGRCQAQLTSAVTHLIATKPSGPKYDCAMRHSDRVQVVSPDWITECVAQKTKIDEIRYHPRLIMFEKPKPIPAPMEVEPMIEHTHPLTSTANIENIEFGGQHEFGGQLMKPENYRTKEALAKMVSNRLHAHGRIGETPPTTPPAAPVPNIPPPPIPMRPPTAICPTSPRPYRPQSPMGHRVGSPRGGGRGRGSPRNTLRNITNSGEPKPVKARNRSPGRGAAKINQLVPGMGRGGYAGRGRGSPVKSPVQAPGGPGLYPSPERPAYYGHDHAENLPSSLCLLGCVFYITDYQKYLEPAKLDAWLQVVAEHGGQVDESYSNRVTHILCDSQRSDVFQMALRDGKRVVTAHWLNDVLVQKRVAPPWMALHFPSIYGKEKPCANQIICVTNFEGEERILVKQMINMIGAKYTGYMTHANSVLVAKKLEGVKYSKAQEWRIPVVNAAWLSDLLLGDLSALKLPVQSRYRIFPATEVFTVEHWRVSHLMGGWKFPIKISKETLKEIPQSQKLMSLVNSQQQMQKRAADENLSPPPEKRQKIESSSHINVREGMPIILITGLPRARAIHLTKVIESLGGAVRSDAAGCSHLVASSISRTVKFLTALSVVRGVVIPEWIEQCARAGHFIDETDFIVRDMMAENSFNFSLRESLNRARRKKLFQELEFYITPSVIPGKNTLRSIVEGAGGRVLVKQPPVRTIRTNKTSMGTASHIVISCENDLHLLRDVMRRGIPIQNAEFVLTGVMRQELDHMTFRIN